MRGGRLDFVLRGLLFSRCHSPVGLRSTGVGTWNILKYPFHTGLSTLGSKQTGQHLFSKGKLDRQKHDEPQVTLQHFRSRSRSSTEPSPRSGRSNEGK